MALPYIKQGQSYPVMAPRFRDRSGAHAGRLQASAGVGILFAALVVLCTPLGFASPGHASPGHGSKVTAPVAPQPPAEIAERAETDRPDRSGSMDMKSRRDGKSSGEPGSDDRQNAVNEDFAGDLRPPRQRFSRRFGEVPAVG